MNNVAVNKGVEIAVSVPAFKYLGINPEVRLLDHMEILCLNFFFGTDIMFSIETIPFYISASNAQWLQFLHILTNLCYSLCMLITVNLIGAK